MYEYMDRLKSMRDHKMLEMNRAGIKNPKTWANLQGAYQRKIEETKARFEEEIGRIKLEDQQAREKMAKCRLPVTMQNQGKHQGTSVCIPLCLHPLSLTSP